MKKMLTWLGTFVIVGNGAGFATANSVIQQMDDNLQRDKTYQIEPEDLSINTLGTAEIDYQSPKINLTKSGIATLNQLKEYYAVSLPNFEIIVNDNKIDISDYFSVFILTTNLKTVANETEIVTLDNKGKFRILINKQWYLGELYLKGIVWEDNDLYLKIFYTFKIKEQTLPGVTKQIGLTLRSGSVITII